MNKPESINSNNKIILFDGVCNLCSGFMHFVYKNDPGGVFKFVWLQDEVGIEILKWIGLPVNKYESIIYIENEVPYFQSTAFIKIVKDLRFPWLLLKSFIIVPAFIRDWMYSVIAKNRYKLFGRKEKCLYPTGELSKRFINKEI